MKKRIMPLLMALLLAMSFAVPSTLATGSRTVSGRPVLRISGTTAYCEADYVSTNSNAKITVTLTLKQGSSAIDSWSNSGTGMVAISETCTVQAGKNYDLVLNATVNGKTQPEVIVSARS